ncbi:MAG: peptide chain release factor 1 [Thermodesulfovibrionales bacterium]|nr:peptide chain release factor 1 [Thermodesulfovibrionales bacterium]
MLDKLKTIEKRHEELTNFLMQPDVFSDPKQYREYSKEQAGLAPLVEKIGRYRRLISEMEGAEELLKGGDGDLRELAQAELDKLKEEKQTVEQEMKFMLLPKDPRDEKGVILEIRAGTGGEEAALFAASLFRMYSRYAESRRWKVEAIDSSPTGLGGIKEIIAAIEGKGAYSRLKYESGVHRVQRVPMTEASGRVHTSAATVAVLPEAEDVDIKVEEKDLRVDTFCASGPGGQGVNTTYSAVRIVHIPTGISVQCQDERSQIKNKGKAMKVLRSKLYEKQIEEQERERALERKSQVGTGDRSERIRTYNYPQNRVTDHRIGLTLYRLEQILEGHMDEIVDSLITHYQTEGLKRL